MGDETAGAAPTTVSVVECHRAADLVRWIARIIEKMGGTALTGPERDNLCRRAHPGELVEFDGRQWIVEAQGLPNLIHELVHALFLGHLDDDHGFDYGAIPLNLEREDHRAISWEELACCALSTSICAPLTNNPRAFARAWFAEQFEILGVFYGLEYDLDGFRATIAAQLEDPARAAELQATVERGRRLVSAALSEVGSADAGNVADPGALPACQILELWRAYLADVASS